MTNFSDTPSDTGVTQTDSFQMVTGRVVADTAVTASDSPSRLVLRFRALVDTGSTVTDQFIRYLFKIASDTGATITESIGTLITPAPNTPYSITSDRNWDHATSVRKWDVVGYNRFAISTVPD